jgi:hypothetical protein
MECDVVITTHGTVTRYWKTGIVIGLFDLDGIVAGCDPAVQSGDCGERCLSLPPDSVPGLRALEAHMLATMNDVATAEHAPEVSGVETDIQVWRNGYDRPAFACQARYAGWVILAGSDTPHHAESGCLAFADPRAGSALTAMPGLPFGRQFLVRPVPGTYAVVPGWLTSSVVPLESGQQITVAVVTSS